MAYGLTKSLDLEASSSQDVSISDASQTGLDLSTDFTLEAWIKIESLASTAGNNQYIISKWETTGSQAYVLFIRFADDKLRCIYRQDASNTTNYDMDLAFGAGDVGNWVHIAVAVDISAATMTFYKNGVLQSSTANATAATTIANSTYDFAIGGNVGANNFDGKISLARVWSDIRTGSEIDDNKCNVFGTSTANLVGEWTFNDVYTDGSGNGNTLTPGNSPVFATDVPATCSVSTDTSNFFLMF